MSNLVKLKLNISNTDMLLAEEVLSAEDLDTLLFGCTDSEDTLLSHLIKVISFARDCKRGMKFVVRANKNLEREVVKAFIYCKDNGRDMRIGVLQFFDTINCFLDKKIYIVVEVM